MLAAKLMSAMAGSAQDKLYVDDVFSTYLYTGNGSTQTINNGIDLAGKGGLVWVKCRNQAWDHMLFDTARGINNTLQSNSTIAADTTSGTLTSFNSNGFSLGRNTNNPPGSANSTQSYISQTFRRAPKFLDVVTYTGNGVAGRQIAHELGIAPGMVIVKRTDAVADWFVYHNGYPSGHLSLNTTAAGAVSQMFGNGSTTIAPTLSYFTISASTGVNANGGQYVAYLFAHDTSADGIIQCGSVTSTAGGAIPAVNLGWEPQYILYKNSGAAWSWEIWDSQRNWAIASTGNAAASALKPNLSEAETNSSTAFTPTATGFYSNANFGASQTFIYLAIRRPNKPPTTGTQVYNAIAYTGTGLTSRVVTGVGFPFDLSINCQRAVASGFRIKTKLTLPKALFPHLTNGESASTSEGPQSTTMDGYVLGSADNGSGGYDTSGVTYINHFFKRAPGVFDVVCYTGTGSATTVAHGLGVAPELMVVKSRSIAQGWFVNCAGIPATDYLRLEAVDAKANGTVVWNSTRPTSSAFSLGSSGTVNTAAATYVAYLFATKAGLSKCGSYTGTGTTQTINCGFTTGARFVLIKRTDSTGDWYMWDTTRGIVAGNDPYLLLNSTAAEVTSTDYIDPETTGFQLSSTAPAAINANGGSFIYLAFA